jgi:hypothetical protein
MVECDNPRERRGISRSKATDNLTKAPATSQGRPKVGFAICTSSVADELSNGVPMLPLIGLARPAAP